MSKRDVKKLAQNDHLLRDVLGVQMYRKFQKHLHNCRCIDDIMNRLDEEMFKAVII